MPKLTNANSADVLDSADAFEDKLNWMLFAQEQDARLFAPRKHAKDWVPGDPMYRHPMWLPDGQGNCPRYMFQEFYLDEGLSAEAHFRIRCVDCGVGWTGDGPCWECGKDCGPEFEKFRMPSLRFDAVTERNRVFMERVTNSRIHTPMELLDQPVVQVECDIETNRYRITTTRGDDVQVMYIDRETMLEIPAVQLSRAVLSNFYDWTSTIQASINRASRAIRGFGNAFLNLSTFDAPQTPQKLEKCPYELSSAWDPPENFFKKTPFEGIYTHGRWIVDGLWEEGWDLGVRIRIQRGWQKLRNDPMPDVIGGVHVAGVLERYMARSEGFPGSEPDWSRRGRFRAM